MAGIRKLPSGKWQASVRHPSGKRITKTDPLKRVVQAWAADKESQMRSGGGASPERGQRVTVEAWWERWRLARRVEPGTAKKNDSHWRNHIKPHWATWPLASIGRLDVQTWVINLTKAGAGADTVHSSYNLLSGMLSDAVLEGILQVSPCREIDLPRVVLPQPRWLTKADYAKVMDALELQDRAHVWRALVALGCYSGLRFPGEIAGLDVEAVDFDLGQVYVSQVLTRDGLRAYPKNDSSIRWVPFPPEVGELLWPLCADRSRGPVFTAPRGGRVNEANFRNRIWKRALVDAGVAYIDPYSMRHTCATWLKDAGLPDGDIADILGHSSTRMVGRYAHRTPGRFGRIRAAWGEAAGARLAHAENEESPHPVG